MKQSQTAGWAILVVLVVIGALAYFGVLTPDSYKPKTMNDTITENECDFVVENINRGYTSKDCFADIFYNRIKDFGEEGTYCFFDGDYLVLVC